MNQLSLLPSSARWLAVVVVMGVGASCCANAAETLPANTNGSPVGWSVGDRQTFRLVQTIPLPQVKGRFDHFAADVKAQRLFVAALGNNTLEVLDVGSLKRLTSIGDLHKPTGVVALSDANQIGVANGDDGTFKVFDRVSHQWLNNVPSLDDADNVRRDAKTHLIYVGYGDGALAVLDRAGRKKLTDIKLPAHPESFQLERDGMRIFVNVPGAKQIAIVDREKASVVAAWPMEKFRSNFPMALDDASRRLFIGCRNPARLVIFDTEIGKPVADVALSGDTDDLFYDAKRRRVYVSCGEGFLDVIQRRDEDNFERITRQPTRAGARTCFYSPEFDRLYLAVPQRGDQDAEIRIYQPL
jgi:DNA-binding beta-propeller fold protein YncE